MKISVVMQSYLGDYPNSRKNPEFKFVRAVSSFLSQRHLDKELIIISDGCDRTKQIYDMLYSHDPRIKFGYVAKKNKKMYEEEINGNLKTRYYSGIPRAVGCSLATGDIICYMDSDDIILPNHLTDLAITWKEHPDSIWCSNSLRIVHKNATTLKNFENAAGFIKDKPINLNNFGYDIHDPFYICISVPEGKVFTATSSISHRKTVKSAWRDVKLVINTETKEMEGTSEDNDFFNQLLAEGKGFIQKSASYVVCHFRFGLWDV